MVVWVKEYLNVLTKKTLEVWLKKNIEIKLFRGFENVNLVDLIIVSDKDKEINANLHNEYNIIVFEETVDAISKQIIKHVYNNFDYYFIKNALDAARTSEIDTIVTGSSYGRLGVNENAMLRTVNLALSSQDIYYSLKGIQQACEKNNYIKNIVICCGYYYFFSDMSKGKDINVLDNISKVYKPIFGEEAYHNCYLLAEGKTKLENPIFDVNLIADIYSQDEYKKGYYNSTNRLRNLHASRCWEDKKMDWSELSEDDKKYAGHERAEVHNKSIKRAMTYRENLKYFNALTDLCKRKKINLLFVITSVTIYYRKYLDRQYKDIFYDTLNMIEGDIHLLDLYEDCSFSDEDFIDTDHLSDSGAEKLTEIISETLTGIESAQNQ